MRLFVQTFALFLALSATLAAPIPAESNDASLESTSEHSPHHHQGSHHAQHKLYSVHHEEGLEERSFFDELEARASEEDYVKFERRSPNLPTPQRSNSLPAGQVGSPRPRPPVRANSLPLPGQHVDSHHSGASTPNSHGSGSSFFYSDPSTRPTSPSSLWSGSINSLPSIPSEDGHH